jgi:hypothetical protein
MFYSLGNNNQTDQGDETEGLEGGGIGEREIGKGGWEGIIGTFSQGFLLVYITNFAKGTAKLQ